MDEQTKVGANHRYSSESKNGGGYFNLSAAVKDGETTRPEQ
nr:hypothetical protein [Pseudomonas caspiana]